MENAVIINGSWQTTIIMAWENANGDTHNENFLDTIWEMSLTAFDKPREVQVVIDDYNQPYISFGTPGFVSFEQVPAGMILPIKCWIHTHPFGSAYFSGTDWKTIRTWQSLMSEAIVLGDNEHMIWQKGSKHTVFYRKQTIDDFNQMVLEQFGMEMGPYIQTTVDEWGGEE
jgi:hypothetical protein